VARTGPRAGRDSAAPTAVRLTERCAKIWESHSRGVGIAAVARVFVVLVIAPKNCSNCCFVGSSGDGVIALVVVKRGCIGVESGCPWCAPSRRLNGAIVEAWCSRRLFHWKILISFLLIKDPLSAADPCVRKRLKILRRLR
jgi:hypothetical protein